jgi:hypothetical protein
MGLARIRGRLPNKEAAMGFPLHRRRLTWTAILVLVAHVGCAARRVPVTPSGVPGAVSAADRTACEELVRAEAKARAAAIASNKPPRSPGQDAQLVAEMLFNFYLIPAIVVSLPFILLEDRWRRHRDREDAVNRCLDPVIQAATLGSDNPGVAWSLANRASRDAAVGNDTHAEVLWDRKAHQEALQDYMRGYIHALSGNYAEAEPLYQRALRVQERALLLQERTLYLGHEDVVRTLESYADLLRKTNRGA